MAAKVSLVLLGGYLHVPCSRTWASRARSWMEHFHDVRARRTLHREPWLDGGVNREVNNLVRHNLPLYR
jgi:hypothetical protein